MSETKRPGEENLAFFGIDPTGKSPGQIELEWFEKYYHGDIPQLTVRAVLIGIVLGGAMSLSNLYVGLKTGWGLGVAITACILSFSIGAALQRIGHLGTNLSILENNCMQSTASIGIEIVKDRKEDEFSENLPRRGRGVIIPKFED